uniref:Synergin gamma C-terminal domain-containing protein n=1 Tax=Tanacetum cinerariifolium TaxID=118510 RepID=A0A6L2N9N2_TANCI|nr:hypothetical protein [Tanacetum cinerariifolium]
MTDNNNDDDEDSFGEFTFASNHTTSQTTTTKNDDVWGDFNFNQKTTTDHNPKWNKINGALPLSLFGDDDDVADEPVKQSDFSNTDKLKSNLGINDLLANLYAQQDNSTLSNSNANNGSDDEGGWEFINALSDSKLAKIEKENEGADKTVSPVGIQNGLYRVDDLFAASSNGESRGMDNGFESKPIESFQNGFTANFKGENGGGVNSNLVGGDDDFDDMFGDFETAFKEQPSKKKEHSEKIVSPPGIQNGSHGPIDLFAASSNGGFVDSRLIDNGFGFDSKPISSFGNGFTADFKDENGGTTNELNKLGESDDFDDTFGDFETAFVEQPSKKELSEESSNPLSPHASHGPVDLFAFSNGNPGGFHTENNGFDFSQTSVGQNGVTSDPFSQNEWNETKGDSDSQPPGGDADDANFGNFEATFAETGSKSEGSEASSKNLKEPVPLSIFGIEEEPQNDDSLNLQHDLFKSSSQGKHTRNQRSSLSINDILSDLYSQAEPVSSAYHEHNPDEKENSLHSTSKEYTSHVGDDDDNDDDDDFDDGSWEFKDASIHPRAEKLNLSFEKKLSNCMDLYSSLGNELSVVARRHLRSLKKAQSTAIHVGDEMKVTSLDKEIQEALEKLHQKDMISTEFDLDDHLEHDISFKQYIETLLEPDFQLHESEYHISRRLSLAESDFQTIVDLINHVTSVLKILTIAPKGEPADYVSLWFKVISVCSQELKHGTWIWKQSLENNVHSEILSEPQGTQFIIALGELYRTVVILGAAVKIYKPWILLSGVDLEGICGLLEECHSLWSTSGLERAVPAESLLESINNIRNLDELAIANEALSQDESRCGLSLLSPGVVPEMKMVIWNGDKYFVALANLWANLISPDPPKLSIHAG